MRPPQDWQCVPVALTEFGAPHNGQGRVSFDSAMTQSTSSRTGCTSPTSFLRAAARTSTERREPPRG